MTFVENIPNYFFTDESRQKAGSYGYLFVTMLFVLFFGAVHSAEAQNRLFNLSKAAGVYKIVSSKCVIPKNPNGSFYDPCRETKFLEIVRGYFNDKREGRINVVLWRLGGNNGELSYAAQSIREKGTLENNRFWIVKGGEAPGSKGMDNEFLVFDSSGVLVSYRLDIIRVKKHLSRHIQYKLVPIKRSDIKKYKLTYPETSSGLSNKAQ